VESNVILAGDVGATKTILGLFSSESGNGQPSLISRKTFRSAAYKGLAPMVKEFLPRGEKTVAACFGVAGPVIDGSAEVTNLSWFEEAKVLASELQVERVSLINDVVAIGYGVTALGESDFLLLNRGRNGKPANAAVIAAGTGLGECALYWDGNRHIPVASEAGHSDFAPYDAISTDLVRYLHGKGLFSNVEQVLSGPGLLNIYSFLRETSGIPEKTEIAEAMRLEDPAAVIVRAASNGECQLCVRTLEIFVSAYGAEAGNLALRTVAVGGIYLAGGIAGRILRNLQNGRFMESFVNKDHQASLLSQIPVRIIQNENTPLFGAVRYLLQH
jgi:glucokinase